MVQCLLSTETFLWSDGADSANRQTLQRTAQSLAHVSVSHRARRGSGAGISMPFHFSEAGGRLNIPFQSPATTYRRPSELDPIRVAAPVANSDLSEVL